MSDEYPCKYIVATLSTRLIKCVGKWDQDTQSTNLPVMFGKWDQDIQSTGYVWFNFKFRDPLNYYGTFLRKFLGI